MNDKKRNSFIAVNQLLNAKPQLGPIPGTQVIPWLVISLISYVISAGLFGVNWIISLLIAVWGCATWWALTGDEYWKFLSKFYSPPNWRQGGPFPYESLLTKKLVDDAPYNKKSRKHRQRRK